MYPNTLPSSRHQRLHQDNQHAEHCSGVDGATFPVTTTLLPLRRCDRARDISATLMAPVAEYHQSPWTMPRSSSSAMQQLYASVHPAILLPSSEASAGKHYDVLGRNLREERAGGVNATTTGRKNPSSPPPLHSIAATRQPHRSRDLAEVRPGWTTTTERVRYRVRVTRKLIELYDEVSELYHCKDNMTHQLTQAMRTDPRHSKEQRGEVQLTEKPEAHQQLALEAVADAMSVLHDAMRELVAAYLTPEEKRHLGIDTHAFQTQMEKKSTYQYAPHPQQSSGGTARDIRGRTPPAGAAAPSSSLTHAGVCEDQQREVSSATEDEARSHAASPAQASAPTADMRSPVELISQQGKHPAQTLARLSDIPNSAQDLPVPAVAADLSAARLPLGESPLTVTQQPVVELSPVATRSPAVTAPLPSHTFTTTSTSAPRKLEKFSGTAKDQKSVASLHTEGMDHVEGTPERVLALAASASTLSSTWRTDTGGGRSAHPQTGPKSPPATQRLVKKPVRGPDGQILITKIPPTIPSNMKWVKVQASMPAATSTDVRKPPQLPPPSTTSPSSRLSSRRSSSASRVPPTDVAQPSAPRPVRPELKRFLVDSDSDSDMLS